MRYTNPQLLHFELQLDISHHIQWKFHLVKAYEGKAGRCNLQVKLCDPCLSAV